MGIDILHHHLQVVLFHSDANDMSAALQEAVRARVRLDGANLDGAHLDHANLEYARLEGAHLNHANLDHANLEYADLDGAHLNYASLNYANLKHARLARAHLEYARLDHANLERAGLGGARLDRASLNSAHLVGAGLVGACLHSANLDHADLTGARFDGAHLDGATGINPAVVCDLRLLREQPGAIRLYKIVEATGVGIYAHTNGYEPITYEVGGTYEVADADTDEMRDCGCGIHLATLPWCLGEWQSGRRILVAEFTTADIAAIPMTGAGKVRVRRCHIVREMVAAEWGEGPWLTAALTVPA